MFQYILCVGSRSLTLGEEIAENAFQYILCVGSSGNICIFCIKVKKVSIHPMCRFKFKEIREAKRLSQSFQYILCVGSREECLAYVSTIYKMFQYILCVGSRASYYDSNGVLTAFQYILCVGSRCTLWQRDG